MTSRPQSETLLPHGREERLSEILSGTIAQTADARTVERRRAWQAWQASNGDRERAHTVYVSLREQRRGGPPVVVVGVDSHAFACDVGANKEIYLQRLSNVGFVASGLEVRVARRRAPRPAEATSSHPAAEALRPLTPDEARRVENIVKNLPEAIRPSASKALGNSIRRDVQV